MNGNLNNALILIDQLLELMDEGFVRCEACGEQEQTKDLDFVDYVKDIKSELLVMVKRESERAVMSVDKPREQTVPFMIGQRVILNGDEVGTIVKPEHNNSVGVWVFSPSKNYASCYAPHNVKPLPNGQF